MHTPPPPQVVTASDLLLGDVVYLTADDRWTRQLSHAERLTDEAHAQMRLLDANRQQDRVVGAYLAEIAPEPAAPRAAGLRESIRATGPTTRNRKAPDNV